MENTRRQELTRRGLEALLEDLDACPCDWLTVCLPPGGQRPPLNDLTPTQAGWLKEVDALAHELDSETGAVFFWSDARRVAILPPFPVTEALCRAGSDPLPPRSPLTAP